MTAVDRSGNPYGLALTLVVANALVSKALGVSLSAVWVHYAVD